MARWTMSAAPKRLLRLAERQSRFAWLFSTVVTMESMAILSTMETTDIVVTPETREVIHEFDFRVACQLDYGQLWT